MTTYYFEGFLYERDKELCTQVASYYCDAENLTSAIFKFLKQIKDCSAKDDYELQQHFKLIQKLMNREFTHRVRNGGNHIYITIEE